MKEFSSLKIIFQSKTNHQPLDFYSKWWVFRVHWSTDKIFLLVVLCCSTTNVKYVFTLPEVKNGSLICSWLAFYNCKINSPLWKTGLRWKGHEGETPLGQEMKNHCCLSPKPMPPSVRTMAYLQKEHSHTGGPNTWRILTYCQGLRTKSPKLQVTITHCQWR